MANSANTYLKVTELDFGEIRNNLKTYLSSQDQFTDYNFEGSAMSVLLDVLAYNTHYNAYYVNMLANEMFLDTAQQRESVVSHAKLLGYTPVSSIGAQANVSLTFTGIDSSITNVTIPKNSKFTSVIDDITYTFVTPEAYTVTKQNGGFSKNITIKEGEPLTHKFVVTDPSSQRFIIPNQNVDMTSITVRVQSSSSDTTTNEFVLATNISQVYSTSNIYFLEEAADQKYEIVFGSGSLGKNVKVGNIVIVDYLVNSGDATNGASTFSKDTLNIGTNYTGVSIVVNTNASGGRPPETIDSIRFNAPKHYQTQNRCVIDNDYQRILLAENPDLSSVIAFGGEEATPAVYGKVFIACKPYGENYITQLRKQQLKESIKNRTPLAVDPVFIDADYTYIVPMITTYYDKSNTTDSTGEIEQAVRDALVSYATNNLERFGNRLRYSKFVRNLDNINIGAIYNNDASLILEKRSTPNTDAAEKLQANFNNPVRKGSLTSSQFSYSGFLSYLDDDGSGNVRIYRFNSERQKVYIDRTAGTLDYDNGIMIIQNFAPTSYADTFLTVSVIPDRLDIIPLREQILLLDDQKAKITLIGESS